MENIENIELLNTAKQAKESSYILSSLNEELKNKALEAVASEIEKNKDFILEANKKDLEAAKIMLDEGKYSKALYDRLKLSEEKLNTIIEGLRDVIKLEDPINKKLWGMELDNDFELYRISCPIGVIGVIFEARPEVVPQIASLAIKSANCVILKGGNEASNSNQALYEIINKALDNVEGFPNKVVNLIKTRHDVAEILKMEDYIDLIIPRGSNSLVKHIKSNTRIPVLGHAEGICHIYTDESAEFNKAVKISVDSKIQYPSACNTVETILVNKNIAKEYLPVLISELKRNEVLVKGDSAVKLIVSDIEQATEEDWATEYSDKIVSIKVVENLDEAICHINTYGSGHTDCIITESLTNRDKFMNLVDSAGVYHNVSTRFADGFRYGFGAEVGISTNKIHSRGPVGLEGLTIYKYKLYGNGQIVAEYAGENPRKFTHKRIL